MTTPPGPGCLLGFPVALWAAWDHAKVSPPSATLRDFVLVSVVGFLILLFLLSFAVQSFTPYVSFE